MTLQEIVDQLESCGYECVAGPLENNVAFQELKKKAKSNDLVVTVDIRGMEWVRKELDSMKSHIERELNRLKIDSREIENPLLKGYPKF